MFRTVVLDPIVNAIADVVRAELRKQHDKIVLEAAAANARAEESEQRARKVKESAANLSQELQAERRNNTMRIGELERALEAAKAKTATALIDGAGVVVKPEDLGDHEGYELPSLIADYDRARMILLDAVVGDGKDHGMNLEELIGALQTRHLHAQATTTMNARDGVEPDVTVQDLREVLIDEAGSDDTNEVRAALDWTGDEENGDVLIVDSVRNLCHRLRSMSEANAALKVSREAGAVPQPSTPSTPKLDADDAAIDKDKKKADYAQEAKSTSTQQRSRAQDRAVVRKAALGVPCTECHAKAGDTCEGKSGSMHDVRYAAGRKRVEMLDAALSVKCPKCGAFEGKPCKDGGKKGLHPERLAAA